MWSRDGTAGLILLQDKHTEDKYPVSTKQRMLSIEGKMIIYQMTGWYLRDPVLLRMPVKSSGLTTLLCLIFKLGMCVLSLTEG